MRRRARALMGVAGGAVLAAAAVGLGAAQEASPPQPAIPSASPASAPSPAQAAPADGNATGDALAGQAPPDEAPPPAAEARADVAPAAEPDAPPPAPLKRPSFEVAVLQVADKVTAETLRFEARVGEPVRYKGLVVTVHACEGTAADEDQPDSVAHLAIGSAPPAVAGRAPPPARQVFRGWMFASSPSLHPLESPGYDVWLIACKTSAPPAPGASA